MNREEYGYYPEAYMWLMCMLGAYLLTNYEPLLYAGIIPGIGIGLYFYIKMINDTRALCAFVEPPIMSLESPESPVNSAGPIVTTLCGSTRFPDAFHLANMHLSLQGRIVISCGMFGHADQPVGAQFVTSDGNEDTEIKQHLDTLHYHKIDISDGIFVCNVGGYIGSSTQREIDYALANGKTVEYMFPDD